MNQACPTDEVIEDIGLLIAKDSKGGLETALNKYSGDIVRHTLIHSPCVDKYERAKRRFREQG